MKLYYIILFLICLFNNVAYSQRGGLDFKILITRDYPEYIDKLSLLYNYIKSLEKEPALYYIDSLRQVAKRNNNIVWKLEADLLEIYYNDENQYVGNKISIQQYLNVAKTAKRNNVLYLRIRVIKRIFDVYWTNGKYEQAFRYLLQVDKLLDKISNQDFPKKAKYLYKIGEAYYYFHDYKQAIRFFNKSLSLPITESNAQAINQSLNTTGLIYQQLNKLDSSDYYFREVISNHKVDLDSVWKGIAYGNLGKNEYLRGNYKRAIPLLKYDFKTALKNGDLGLAAGSGTLLADIFIRKGQLKKAKFYIDTSFSNIKQSRQYYRYRSLYPIMSMYQTKIGNPDYAIAYMDSASIYQTSYNNKFNSRLLIRVNQKTHQMQVDKMKAAEKRERLLWKAAIIVLVLILVILGLGFYWNRQRSKMRQHLSDMEIEKKTKELEEATIQLNQFANTVSKNQILIQTLKKRTKTTEDYKILDELQKSRILTNEDWSLFKNRFNKVYHGFINNLKEEYPELTQSEIRYLSLVKLGLSNNEIATTTGVSPKSLNVTWFRLRQKLNLSKEISPEFLIRELEKSAIY